MTWRLTVRYDFGDEVHDLVDVGELRAAVARLRGDPRVHGYTWRRVDETPRRTACTTCGRWYAYGDITERTCRCGVSHLVHHCLGCSRRDIDPPMDKGCGPIPHDAEGIAIRRWRLSR